MQGSDAVFDYENGGVIEIENESEECEDNNNIGQEPRNLVKNIEKKISN
jgi:hypothetical protein